MTWVQPSRDRGSPESAAIAFAGHQWRVGDGPYRCGWPENGISLLGESGVHRRLRLPRRVESRRGHTVRSEGSIFDNIPEKTNPRRSLTPCASGVGFQDI